jgi:fructokinase
MNDSYDLIVPINETGARVNLVVVGEVLWDILKQTTCIGGAPLNFSVHCRRLGHRPLLISAVGNDDLGERALAEIASTGLPLDYIQRSNTWKTGTASVTMDANGQPNFLIQRPAAYDDVRLSDTILSVLQELEPSWLYFGTLFPSQPKPKKVLERLLQALPNARRFYDVNLRPGFESPELIAALIAEANVVKLNQTEAQVISRLFGLPADLEAFCRAGANRFGWTSVCVTLGADGCALFSNGEFHRAEGLRVRVADTVGAGDAFAAALLHGLVQHWPIAQIAQFANRVGALVASRTGAIPDWHLAEVARI